MKFLHDLANCGLGMHTLRLVLLCLGTAHAARDRTGMMSLVLCVATVSAWVPAGGGVATAAVSPQPAVGPAMFSSGIKAAPKKRAVVKPATKRAPKPVFKKVAKKAATKKRAPAKVQKRAPPPPAVKRPVAMRPAVNKPAVRKPVNPRPGTVLWSGNGQRTVVPRKTVRPPPPKPKPKSMLKSSTASGEDFSPLPLLGVVTGALLFTALASARAPPPPSVDANSVLACIVLAGLAAFVFTGDEKVTAPMAVTAPADAPAEPVRKRDRLRRMFDLRRKAATAADAAATEAAPADAPADGAEPSTPGRFGRFRARFSTNKT